MRITLKDNLRACRVDLKKNLSKREKWVKDWPGQMLITASQIQWTADSEKALNKGDKKGLKSLKKKQVHDIYSTCILCYLYSLLLYLVYTCTCIVVYTSAFFIIHL